jgi:hypothetical protein
LDDDGQYQSISSALVRIVTQGVSNKAKLYEAGRGRKRLIAALTTLPIWLLIVLLSPMEAYAAAKAITRQL